jgi:hypothetical protein
VFGVHFGVFPQVATIDIRPTQRCGHDARHTPWQETVRFGFYINA